MTYIINCFKTIDKSEVAMQFKDILQIHSELEFNEINTHAQVLISKKSLERILDETLIYGRQATGNGQPYCLLMKNLISAGIYRSFLSDQEIYSNGTTEKEKQLAAPIFDYSRLNLTSEEVDDIGSKLIKEGKLEAGDRFRLLLNRATLENIYLKSIPLETSIIMLRA